MFKLTRILTQCLLYQFCDFYAVTLYLCNRINGIMVATGDHIIWAPYKKFLTLSATSFWQLIYFCFRVNYRTVPTKIKLKPVVQWEWKLWYARDTCDTSFIT